jgi:hypothetical protein
VTDGPPHFGSQRLRVSSAVTVGRIRRPYTNAAYSRLQHRRILEPNRLGIIIGHASPMAEMWTALRLVRANRIDQNFHSLSYGSPLSLVRRFKSLKPSHKGGPPQTVVRGGTCVNRRG